MTATPKYGQRTTNILGAIFKSHKETHKRHTDTIV